MLEAALFAIIAGSLWVVATQFKKRYIPALPGNHEIDRRSLSLIAGGGLYQIATPSEAVTMRAFRDMYLIEGGISLRDNQSGQTHFVDFSSVQWVSAVTFPGEGIAAIRIHLESGQRWRVLSIQIPEADMSLLVKVLRRVINASRLNIGRPPANPIGPLVANITEDTLQGVSSLGAEVSLYLLPHILIVLQGDIVRAKLDTSSIRRVLSVEKVSNRLDNLLHPATPDGVIRLYSLYETVAFALPQFRELAEEISYLSRCPVEFITQDDKTDKM